jgi:Na+/melibiose symporter-like transporter
LPAIAFAPEPNIEPGQHLTLKDALKALAENKALKIALAADFAIGVSQGVSGSLFVFFFQLRLGFMQGSEALLLVYFLAALIGVPAWMAVAKKGAKHKAIGYACFYAAGMTLLLPFLPPGAFAIAAIGLFFAGFANGAHIFLLRAMMADVIDEDEARTGQRRAGLFFGMLLTTSKMGSSLGPVTFAILALFGFDGRLGVNNSPQALGALTALFILAPAALYTIAGLALRFYPLSEARQRELRAQLGR